MTELHPVMQAFDDFERRWRLTRACHDTMRELAAVAGLALCEEYWDAGLAKRGMSARFVPPVILAAFARHLGWEAPDA